MNVYHRLLECYLYQRQINQNKTNMRQLLAGGKEIEEQINNLISLYDGKMDKNYVLFLFQIYNYSEGVQECC